MKRTVSQAALLLALLVIAGAGPAVASEGWTENVKQAMAQATKEGKDLLMDFTGSDWCGWCIKLDKEVFTQEPFATEAPKKFVLVKLDFPRRRKMPAEVKKQNEQWKDKLGVGGFPTIYLVDAKGRPYAKTGYRRGGPEAYMKHLTELQKGRITRDKFLARAAKAKGLAKAKLLDKALGGLDMALVMGSYGGIVDEIIRLDSKNKAGLKGKYAGQRTLAKVQKKVDAANRKRDTAAALKAIDDAIKDLKPTGTVSQELHFMKSLVLYRKGDKAGAKTELQAARAAAPKTAKAERIEEILRRTFSDK